MELASKDTSMKVWRPEVHRRFGETLFYFLISFRQFQERTFDQLLESLTNELKLSGFCLYNIFGYYDCLLRVWLNPRAYESLVAVLESKPFVDSISDCAISDQRHWAFEKKRMDPLAVAEAIARFPDPESYAKAQQGEGDWYDRFENAGLITQERAWFPGKVKFYMSIASPTAMMATSRRSIEKEVWATLEEFKKSRNGGITHPSAYTGRGFASSLVKAVSPNLGTLMNFAQALRGRLHGYSLHSETFIIGNRICPERDDIQPGSLGAEYVRDTDVYAWIPELYEAGTAPSVTADRLHLIEAYLHERKLFRDLDFQTRSWLGRLVVALARESMSSSTQAPEAADLLSSWFRQIESWLREHFDNYVVARTQGKPKSALKGVPRNPMFASLGALLTTIEDLAEKSGANSFSDAERSSANAVVNLRNLVQHNDTHYLTNWRDTLETVTDFLPAWARIREEVETGLGELTTQDD